MVKVTEQRPFLKTATRFFTVRIDGQPTTMVMATASPILTCDTHETSGCDCIEALRNSTLLEASE